jgi:hypothetical protein
MFEISERKKFSSAALLSILFPIIFSISCGSSTATQSAIDIANNDLTSSDCGDALTTILPVYNSSSSNNQVRLVTASAYGCDAGVNFFQVLTNFGLDGNTITTASLLGYLAQVFPSTTADKVVESGGYGLEVLMTTLTTGEVIAPGNLINSTSYNPGSLSYVDQIPDSNLYMLLMSMATLGGAASRNANLTTFHPTNASTPLPWVNNTSAMSSEGCTVAAAAQDFVDVFNQELNVIVDEIPSSVATQFKTLESQVTSGTLDLACEYGCKGTMPAGGDILTLNILGHWQATGCTLSTCGNGGHCPAAIRDWNQCKVNTPTDPVGCAAAGVINYLNSGGLWF